MTEVENLSLQAIDVKPIDIDWREALDLEGERGQFWEAFTYEVGETDDDEREFTLIANNGTVVGVVIDDVAYKDWDAYEDDVLYGLHEDYDPDDEDTFPEGAITEEFFDRLMEVEPYMHGSEGPMMNYWYPINDNAGEYGKDPLDLAAKIGHLPLCVVEVEDNLGLALTGGGMDLSWQICAAFVALGMAPPVHFAHLPAMAETWTEDRHERVYEAMRRSLEVQIGQHERALAELGNLKSRMINRSN